MDILSHLLRSWPPPARFRAAFPARRALLALLFVAGAAAGWMRRIDAAEAASVIVLPPAAPILSTPIPTASQAGRTGELELHGSSGVWEAPPVARPAPSAPYLARPRLPTAATLPRTPADEVDRWVVRLAIEQHSETRRALERMAAFEPLIHEALQERGLPTDLLYLALIESHFVPTATSRAGAVGIWQFMPATARASGLEVSEYVDERRDPVRSTRAAVRHLEWLHRQFGSWHLALAAYNAGDGRVGGVLRSATGSWKGDDLLYWRARPLLPAETQAYVPKLLAASRIARAPEHFGFVDLAPRAPLRFREVSVPGGVELASVAEAVGTSPEEVYALNPHLVRRTTPPGRRWPVRVPAEPGQAVVSLHQSGRWARWAGPS
jgi:membrane-bound lytic murein transglycosylase D